MSARSILGHLLVVDDDEFNRDLLSRRLAKVGYTFELAANGAEACALVKSTDFDLVLLDVEMPGLSGLEVLDWLRASNSPAELPVILVTARSDSRDVAEGLDRGANDYVPKPIDFTVALARVRNQLTLKRTETARRESEERYALATAGSRDGIWDWNLRTGEVYYSERWKEIVGCAGDEMAPLLDDWISRIHPEDRARVDADLQAHLTGTDPHFENEHRILHRDGFYRWVVSRGIASRDDNGVAHRMAGSQTDVTATKLIEPLTGLPNRLLFMDRVSRLVERSRRHEDYRFAVLFIAIDQLKLVSDSLGRDVRDQLLVAVSKRLQAGLRSTDTVADSPEPHTLARHGGGEFTVLLDDVADAAHANAIGARITALFEDCYHVADHEVFATAHVGIALGSPTGLPEDFLRNADIAMHHAKTAGNGRVKLFNKEMRETAISRLRIETDLRHAVDRGQFENWYQPIVCLVSGEIQGVEALVRWRHSDLGVVGPADFIPVAEQTGLIIPIGRGVLKEACIQLSAWSRNLAVGGHFSVSVNLSRRQLESNSLRDELEETLLGGAFQPDQIKLEITEGLVMNNPEQSRIRLNELKALGVHIVMDDFGTGYSSLSYLKDLPVDEIKIDRAFVVPIEEGEEEVEIVRTIVLLAHNLGLRVTAEGVENESQLGLLTELGCDSAQGYFFSRPLEPSQTDAFLRTGLVQPLPRTTRAAAPAV